MITYQEVYEKDRKKMITYQEVDEKDRKEMITYKEVDEKDRKEDPSSNRRIQLQLRL